MFVIELDVLHLEAAAPLGLVAQTILERTARVLLSDEELYRFRVVKLRERLRKAGAAPNGRGLSSLTSDCALLAKRDRSFGE